MNDVAVEVSHLWKRFHRGEFHDSLRDLIPALARRLFGRAKKPDGLNGANGLEENDFWALRDVSFQVRRGEVLGIIGSNGAGKSTLLKILARILKPNRGRVKVNGRLRALIEIAAGFHPDLTGRENIYLNGCILGMKRAEIARKFDEIVEFSGIRPFLDTPVKRYSSGMYARLGFAVAAHLEPDILVVDEVLAVGDTEFQAKCLGKMHHVAGEGRTVLFVSHNMRAVMQLCQRAIVLDHGRVVLEGPAREVVSEYLGTVFSLTARGEVALSDDAGLPLAVSALRTLDPQGRKTQVFFRSGSIAVEMEGEVRRPGDYIVAIDVRTMEDDLLFRTHSFEQPDSFGILRTPGRFRLRCEIPAELLPAGKYLVGLVTAQAGVKELQDLPEALEIEVLQDRPLRGSNLMGTVGLVTPRCAWQKLP